MLSRLKSKYQTWIFNAFSSSIDQLGIYRILFTLFVFFIAGVPQFATKMAYFPEGIFNPPPFFSLFFHQIPAIWYFQVTDVLIYLALFTLLLGLCTRASGIILSLLIITNNGFIFSLGKIDHSFLIWLTPFLLSFSGWGASFSLDKILLKKRTQESGSWTISLMAMLLGFGLFTSGLIKFVSGWLSLNEPMLRGFFLRNYYVQLKQDYLASYFEHFNFRPFWEFGDWFTVLFELLFLVLIFFPKWFRINTLVAIFFHALVLLMLNISFHHYLVVYFLFWIAFIPETQIQRFRTLLKAVFSNRLKCILVVLVFSIFALLNLSFKNQIQNYTGPFSLMLGLALVLYLFIFKLKFILSAPPTINKEL